MDQAAQAALFTGAAQVAAQIDNNVRTLPEGKARLQIVANGLESEANGFLNVSGTSRSAVPKVAIGAEGKDGMGASIA